MKTQLVLASASPARLRTLRAAGIDPEVVVSGVDESTVGSPHPETLCLTLARLKARAVAERLRHHGHDDVRTLVLGCDSVLALDGEILGKPADAAEATARWRRMRGHAGVLHTGHCLVTVDSVTVNSGAADGGRAAEAVASTTVHFADITDAEIEAYVGTGEPLRVAGAFTIDGLGGPFVERIEGDPGTVIGLSLPLLRHLLDELGISVTALWQRQLASAA